MRKRRKIFMAATALLATMLMMEPVGVLKSHAAETNIATNQGTITLNQGSASLTIRGNEGQSLKGKKFRIYQLFAAENSTGNESIDYTMNPRYFSAMKTVVATKLGKASNQITEYMVIDYMQSLNQNKVEGAETTQQKEGTYSNYRHFLEDVIAQFHQETLDSEYVLSVNDTKSDNTISLQGLAYGYYLVEEASVTEGTHSAVSMLMVNTSNPNSTMNIKSDYPTATKKIQEDDNRDTIGNQGWNDIADFEIGQNVPYRFQTTIPDINGYQTYYLAFHDKMDEALTLQNNTIQVRLEGLMNAVKKQYILQAGEYEVVEDVVAHTFSVKISDIKSIVDREFDQKNSNQENLYGQSLEVSYLATLNDKAALDTGRPGFENDMRLEFSNNPNANGAGETGFTPWDTVVCFTYQINGVKVNNYGTTLEGAVFRLYSDEACTNEVYVKKVADRYHVMNRDSVGGGTPTSAVGIVSEANGKFDICGLDGGIYYLKEISAPAGYRPLLDPIRIDVKPVMTEQRNSYTKGEGAGEQVLTLQAQAYIKTFVNGGYTEKDTALTVDQEKGSMNLSVLNEIGKKLPITGSYIMPILIGGGVVMMLYAGKREQKKHE